MNDEEELLERLGAERCDWCNKIKQIVQWIIPHDSQAVEKLNQGEPWSLDVKAICQDCLNKQD